MSRKSNSFSQLYDYLMRDKSNFSFTRNAYSNSQNKEKLIKEFFKNYKFLKDCWGKVRLYHEIISLEINQLSKERQKEENPRSILYAFHFTTHSIHHESGRI